jgi:hypothetical protein
MIYAPGGLALDDPRGVTLVMHWFFIFSMFVLFPCAFYLLFVRSDGCHPPVYLGYYLLAW